MNSENSNNSLDLRLLDQTNINVRLFDLVRYCRSYLHEEGLITDEEYEFLLSGSPLNSGGGSPSPRRLEDYDKMRIDISDLEYQVKKLKMEKEELREFESYVQKFGDYRKAFENSKKKA